MTMCTMRDFLDLAALVNILDKKKPLFISNIALLDFQPYLTKIELQQLTRVN